MIATKKNGGVVIGTKFGAVSRFKLVVRKEGSDEVIKESGWSENLIPTTGLDLALRGEGNPRLAAKVGTGNTPPAMTDTALRSPHGGISSGPNPQAQAVTWQTTVAPYWRKATATFRFPAGTFNNTNIAEVGTFAWYAPSNMYSRALVVDALGNPTAVTLLIDEVLDVLWEHYTIIDISTGSFNQLIDGVSTPFTYKVAPIRMTGDVWGAGADLPTIQPGSGVTRQSNLFHSATDTGAVTGNTPQDGISNDYFNSTTGAPSYVVGSLLRRLRYNVSLNLGNNVNGINAMTFDISGISCQMYITPAVLKVGTKTYYVEMDVSMTNASLPE